jgi:hypothetical protein
MIRGITGTGAGHGAMLAIHDGFVAANTWYDFAPGADRFALDTHPCVCTNAPGAALTYLIQVPRLWRC